MAVMLLGVAAGLFGVGAVVATSGSSDCATGGAVANADNQPGSGVRLRSASGVAGHVGGERDAELVGGYSHRTSGTAW